jgi:hypothetical protein
MPDNPGANSDRTFAGETRQAIRVKHHFQSTSGNRSKKNIAEWVSKFSFWGKMCLKVYRDFPRRVSIQLQEQQ